MKNFKIRIFITFIILIFSFIPNIYGYSTSKYEIDIPSNYTQTSENSFIRDDGCNINIVITSFNNSSSNTYTSENLDEITKSVTNLESLKSTFKNTLIDKYDDMLSNEQISTILNTIKINSINKKEISSFSKNNYKCFHIAYSLSILDEITYTEQYTTISNKEAYIITFTGTNEKYCNSDEIKTLLNSFTIKNFEEISSNNISNERDDFNGAICLTIISVFIGGTIYLTTTLTKKNKQTKSSTTSPLPIKDDKEHIYCVYCGTKSNIKDNYCTNCGRELKK